MESSASRVIGVVFDSNYTFPITNYTFVPDVEMPSCFHIRRWILLIENETHPPLSKHIIDIHVYGWKWQITRTRSKRVPVWSWATDKRMPQQDGTRQKSQQHTSNPTGGVERQCFSDLSCEFWKYGRRLRNKMTVFSLGDKRYKLVSLLRETDMDNKKFKLSG